MKEYNKFKEQDQIIQFLINDSYNVVRGQILLMKELSSVWEVYSLIIQDEKQREIGSPVIGGVSIAAAVKTQKRAVSSHHRSGNQTSFRGTPTSNERTLHCTHCNQDHHTIDHCYKLHGYPLGYNFIMVVPTHLGMLTQEVHHTMKTATNGALHLFMRIRSKQNQQQLRPKLNNPVLMWINPLKI